MWKLGHYSCVQQRSAQHPCQRRKREVVLLEELPSSLSQSPAGVQVGETGTRVPGAKMQTKAQLRG